MGRKGKGLSEKGSQANVVVLIIILVAGAYAAWSLGWFGGTDSSPAAAPEFTPATAQQIEHISAFLEDGFSLGLGYTVPAKDREQAHFVAAEIVAPGLEGYVGVWMHYGTPEQPGMTLSVDHYADEACVCPWGRETRANITMSDPPAQELQRFVRSKIQITPLTPIAA